MRSGEEGWAGLKVGGLFFDISLGILDLGTTEGLP